MAAVEEATALKQKGNKAVANHDWLEAVDYYTKAIEKFDQDPSFFCNRAQACSLILLELFHLRRKLTESLGRPI